MISVVCVYNNEETLKNVLLKSLKRQTADFDLIALDNRSGRFGSAAEALNHGGLKAKGDYIMFVHQDVWLASESWLADAEKLLGDMPDMGVAGIAGMSGHGRNWEERVKFSIGVFDEAAWEGLGVVDKPEEVQTLDECLLIVTKGVFERLRFDETTFDGWDCYGADFCLSVTKLGLKAYVLPLPASHCCLRASHQIWEFAGLLKYQNMLYSKHRDEHKRIYTWMGDVSWSRLKLRALMCRVGPIYERLFPHMFGLMKRELSDCSSVLDLGCGQHSPLQVCSVPYSVGVELFEPSLQESRRKRIHTEYMKADIRAVEFKPKSFDAVIAVEVLEHLTREEGVELLGKMAEWARKKVVVTTPNGYIWQGTYDNNPLQEHRSGWSPRELRQFGFTVRGMAGWRGLRGYKGSIKFRPAFFWARVSDISQKATWYWAERAFQLLAVRRITEEVER